MNSKHKHLNLSEWSTVITISIVVSIFNILHVITGLAKTPKDFTYLAPGHYYLDYFYYLHYIAQGITRHWLPLNYFSTDDFRIQWQSFPYLFVGKIAGLLHWSPVLAYWLSVVAITFLILLGFYYIISRMLKEEPFYLKITAFLISIVSGPFYQIIIQGNRFNLNPYDFWYGPGSFTRRFGLVPYHSLGLFLLILIIIITDRFWKKISTLSLKNVSLYSMLITFMAVMLVTFSPFAIAPFVPAIMTLSLLMFIKEKNTRIKMVIFNLILLLFLLPTVLILRNNSQYAGISFEVLWIIHPSFWYMLLNFGPIVLFFPFGLQSYLQSNNFLRRFLLFFTLASYVLFFSPLAYYLKTHNLRFLSSVSYIFFAVWATLGIKKIACLIKGREKLTFVLISVTLIAYSCVSIVFAVSQRVLGEDIRIPNTILSYIPNPLIKGIQTLQNYPEEKMVLTGPYGQIGMLVPIFGYRKVYVGHQDATLDLLKKQSVSNRFFTGEMSGSEARSFLKNNRLGLVVLSTLDHYDPNKIDKFAFLKKKFSNQYITIWEVVDYGKAKKDQ